MEKLLIILFAFLLPFDKAGAADFCSFQENAYLKLSVSRHTDSIENSFERIKGTLNLIEAVAKKSNMYMFLYKHTYKVENKIQSHLNGSDYNLNTEYLVKPPYKIWELVDAIELAYNETGWYPLQIKASVSKKKECL